MTYNKLVLFVLILSLMPLITASNLAQLPPIKQNDCMPLVQYCANCTYVNITSITYPNGTVQQLNYLTSLQGQDTYVNNSFCSTSALGTYVYGTYGNPDGVRVSQSVAREVTPTGNQNMLGFYILVIVVCYGVLFIGVMKSDLLFGGLGSLMLYILGIWVFVYGIDIFRNYVTDAFAAITIGVAMYGTLQFAKEINDNV